MQKFKAYRTFEENKVVTSRFVDMTLDELDPGDVVDPHQVLDDQLQGRAVVQRRRQDHAQVPDHRRHRHGGHGRVVAATRAGSAGDKVIVTGYDLGVAHDGGYAEYVRVPADWVVRRPESMTAFDAMTLGTAGFTAALAIMLMEHNGLKPANGPVAVTGATGGVGSVAIEILAKLGYHVVAITGKAEEADYLQGHRREGSAAAPVARPRRRSGRSTRRRGPAPSTTSAATCWRGCCRR